jgi:hypothetical protein
MLEQHMLPGAQVVRSLTKLICDTDQRCGVASVLNAGIAVPCDAKTEIKRSGALDRKPQVWRQNNVAGCCSHLHLNRSTIEREHQRLSASSSLACSNMQPAGRADSHCPSAGQCDLGSVVFGGNCRASHQHRASIRYLERACNCRILHSDSPDGLLGHRCCG